MSGKLPYAQILAGSPAESEEEGGSTACRICLGCIGGCCAWHPGSDVIKLLRVPDTAPTSEILLQHVRMYIWHQY
jgi:hypothetical protein